MSGDSDVDDNRGSYIMVKELVLTGDTRAGDVRMSLC